MTPGSSDIPPADGLPEKRARRHIGDSVSRRDSRTFMKPAIFSYTNRMGVVDIYQSMQWFNQCKIIW